MFSCFKNSKKFYKEIDFKSQKSVSRVIDKNLRSERKRNAMKYQILLLGTGESGKSTFLKQLKIICGIRFTIEEREMFKDIIFDNIFKGILFLIDARQKLQIDWTLIESQNSAEIIENFYEEYKNIHRERRLTRQYIWKESEFQQIVPYLKIVWNDTSIQQAFLRRNELITEHFSENTRYYLNKIEEIGSSNYDPSDEDIVWTRKPTETIIETELNVSKGTILVFIDVGGQTKERLKWCKLFHDMRSVLFLIACSHFDEEYLDRFTLTRRNKLKEAIVVFEDLINQNAFLNVSVLLFFNKTDIFTEKIQSGQTDIRKDFPDFPDELNPQKLENVQKFIVDLFVTLVDNPHGHNRRMTYSRCTSLIANKISTAITVPVPKRTVYKHFTTAVDKSNIEQVFTAMKDTILQNNIRKFMMN